MSWQTKVLLMLFAEAVYFASVFGAWGYFYLNNEKLRNNAIAKASARKRKQVVWNMRYELLFLLKLALAVLIPLINTYFTFRIYYEHWKETRGF